MNQYDVWRYRFDKKILRRAQEYADDGKIEVESFNNGTFYLNAYGSKTYQVEVEMDEDGVLDPVRCDCPYFKRGFDCKHMAGAVIYLEDHPDLIRQFVEEEENREAFTNDRNASIKRIVDTVSIDELKNFVCQLLSDDLTLFDDFLFKTHHGEVELLLDYVDEELGDVLRKIESAHNKDRSKDLVGLEEEMRKLLEHVYWAELNTNDPQHSLYITYFKTILTLLREYLPFLLENEIDLTGVLGNSLGAFLEEANPLLKRQALDTLTELYKDDIKLREIIGVLLEAVLPKKQFLKTELEVLDNTFKANKSLTERDQYVKRRLQLMKELGVPYSEVKAFILENEEVPFISFKLYQKALNEKNYDRAEEILLGFPEDFSKKYKVGQNLLEVYKLSGETEKYRNCILDRIKTRLKNRGHFFNLKQFENEDSIDSILNNLKNRIPGEVFAEILIDCDKIETLKTHLQSHPELLLSEEIIEYFNADPKERSWAINTLRKYFKQKFEKANSRFAYQRILDELEALDNYQDGQNTRLKIVSEWRKDKIFLEVLDKAGYHVGKKEKEEKEK